MSAALHTGILQAATVVLPRPVVIFQKARSWLHNVISALRKESDDLPHVPLYNSLKFAHVDCKKNNKKRYPPFSFMTSERKKTGGQAINQLNDD